MERQIIANSLFGPIAYTSEDLGRVPMDISTDTITKQQFITNTGLGSCGVAAKLTFVAGDPKLSRHPRMFNDMKGLIAVVSGGISRNGKKYYGYAVIVVENGKLKGRVYYPAP